jgi:CRP/FNR family transcriptional regulator, cyclic AMP receptor protein
MSTANPHIHDLVIPKNSRELISFKKDDLLFGEGDDDNYVYFVLDGEIKIFKKKWLLWSAKAKELVGISSYFSDGTSYSFSAKAGSDCQVYRIANGEFEKMLVNDPKFSRAVMDMLCDRIRLTNTRTKSMLEQPSKFRLIQELIKKTKDHQSNLIPYNLEDLSGLVGVSVRLIRNMISDLEQKKLIERSKGVLIIHDLKGLEIIAKMS